MRSSWRLGQWFGIQVKLHASFLLLLLFVMISAWSGSGSLLSVVLNLALVAALFGFVVLHEYGHALTARRFGIRTRQITLYPIGGVAMLERMPDDPRQQILIALAGPAVNFVIAAGLSLTMVIAGIPFDTSGGTSAVSEVFSLLLAANLTMGLFNLIPALPMDGGRVLKAWLQRRHSPVRATQLAARVARRVAILMALYAVWPPSQLMLLVIAGFVWIAAGAEERAALASAPFERSARAPRGGNPFFWGAAEAVPRKAEAAPPAAEEGRERVRVRAYVTDAYRKPQEDPYVDWQSVPASPRRTTRRGSSPERLRLSLRLEPSPTGPRLRLVWVPTAG